MSIYHKTCPACTASVPRENDQCDCGYSFVTEEMAVPGQEEELYLNYLNARIEQLVTEVEVARASLAERPSSFERALAVMRAVSTLRSAREDLDVQEKRLHTMADNSLNKDIVATAKEEIEEVDGQSEDESSDVLAEQSLDAIRAHAPGAAFRALQATRAARVMSGSVRECPNCRASNAPDATRCACGYKLAPISLPDIGESGEARPSRK